MFKLPSYFTAFYRVVIYGLDKTIRKTFNTNYSKSRFTYDFFIWFYM